MSHGHYMVRSESLHLTTSLWWQVAEKMVCVYYIFLFQITQKGYISSIVLKLDKSQWLSSGQKNVGNNDVNFLPGLAFKIILWGPPDLSLLATRKPGVPHGTTKRWRRTPQSVFNDNMNEKETFITSNHYDLRVHLLACTLMYPD